MANDNINAMAVALDSEFGADYEIHTEQIRQGMKEPCFFISLISQATDKYPSGRYRVRNLMRVLYFPKSEDCAKEECLNAAERMRWALEVISPPDTEIRLRGTDMHYEIVDDVLNFFVNYSYFMRKTAEKPMMEYMQQSTGVKGRSNGR